MYNLDARKFKTFEEFEDAYKVFQQRLLGVLEKKTVSNMKMTKPRASVLGQWPPRPVANKKPEAALQNLSKHIPLQANEKYISE